MQFPEEDIPFLNILKSMGIDEYDPLVPIAINEYAAKFAVELLKDAKDYSNHAKRVEIEPDDVKLAVKLSDVRVTGLDQRESVVHSIRDKINKKILTELADPNSVINRYPINMFCQRTHTYIPGSEGYLIDEDKLEEKSEMYIEQDQQEDQKNMTNNELTNTHSEQSNVVKFQTNIKTVSKKLEAVPGFSD